MKVFIGIPTYDRKVDFEIAQGVGMLVQEGYDVEVFSPVSSQIARARNRCVHVFLETEAEWLLFWDADIVPEKGFLTKMLETADLHKAGIVCGAYKIKDDSGRYVLTELTDRGEKGLAVVDSLKGISEVREVYGGGTGLMLINRSVFSAVKDPWFTIIDQAALNIISEDYHFCRMARDAGIKVMADPRFYTKHYGQFAYKHVWQ